MKTEFAINEETGKSYEIRKDRFEEYPHLMKLKSEAEMVRVGSVKYWELRCRYLEKAIDETYGTFERDTCRILHIILMKREI